MSRWCSVGGGFAALAAGIAACAGTPKESEAPVAAPTASAAPSAAVAPVSEAPPAAETRENPPAASAAAPTATPPEPAAAASILSICSAKCDKLVNRCGGSAVESCRLNCGKYDPPPSGCGNQVRAALECARDARDLTCANVAPDSCARKFREIAACAAGEATPAEQAPAGLPQGWEQVNDTANGFTVPMPSGSIVKAEGEGPVRSVTTSDGTKYSVSVLPPLKDKPSEKVFLHLMLKVQGRCGEKVKLDGFVEKAGRSSIHYKAHCQDKTDWDGMIYTNNQHLFLLSAQAPFGKIGITEPFFYGFQFTSH